MRLKSLKLGLQMRIFERKFTGIEILFDEKIKSQSLVLYIYKLELCDDCSWELCLTKNLLQGLFAI